ncbi:MAG TPA: caspase family protein [Opitutaceae bacterium]|nr:caspase family protein [Opitutaceae bacterium]
MAASYSTSYRASWALVIGIDRYQHVTPLSFAGNDAISIDRALVESLGFPKENIVMLRDEQATRAAIRKEFLAFAERCSPDDRIVVFFAGHGASVDGHRGKVGYLVPVEGTLDDKSTLVRWDDLVRDAEHIPAKHIFFIMDACYSGLMLQRSLSTGNERFLSDMLQRFSRQALTAGKHDELVADGGGPEGRNSIFTGHLVRGLEGAAADSSGVITASGLMHYVYSRVAGDNRSNQTPHCGHLDGSGDMVLKVPDGPVIDPSKHLDRLVVSDFAVLEPDTKFAAEVREPVFLAANGYGDPKSSNFGLNEWTERLGEVRLVGDVHAGVKAERFLTIVAEPVARLSRSIDPAVVANALRQRQWPDPPPYPRQCLPDALLTTLNSAVIYSTDQRNSIEKWKRFLRIEEDGTIEFADCYQVVKQLHSRTEQPGARVWLYVQLIGFVWSVLYVFKAAYAEMGYARGVRLSVNLIGTKDSYLVDFANGEGVDKKRWLDPLSGMGGEFGRTQCNDANLPMAFQVALANMNDAETRQIIEGIAGKIGRAFNHQSDPRCFNYGTRVFPWNEYSPYPY